MQESIHHFLVQVFDSTHFPKFEKILKFYFFPEVCVGMCVCVYDTNVNTQLYNQNSNALIFFFFFAIAKHNFEH